MKYKKCLFLIPTCYNDKREIPASVIDSVFDELYLHFGSYTIDGITEGTWKMSDGKKAIDRCYKVWIIISEEQVILLKGVIKKFVKLLEQEAIYFEVMDCNVEFIGPE
jgi:hypothetical protein